MTLEAFITETTNRLAAEGLENPRTEAEFLIAGVLQIPKPELVLHRSDEAPSASLCRLEEGVRARLARKPLAYILEEQPFMDLELTVNPDVLIPRPETEELVERVCQDLLPLGSRSLAIDVGTGSGNIALSLAKRLAVKRIIGIDRSGKALAVARFNAKKLGISRCEWLEGDLLEPLGNVPVQADVIVANLPYVRTALLETLAPELHWEPRSALDGGDDGLLYIRALLPQAARHLRPGGSLYLEIANDQAAPVCALFSQDNGWETASVFKDLAGWPRIVRAIRKGDSNGYSNG